jgi:hypothetical protein
MMEVSFARLPPPVSTYIQPSNFSTTFTVQEQSGNAQTNMPFMFGLPLAPAALPSGSIVQILDGASQQVVQTDQAASDLAKANVRFVAVSGVLSALGANASKQLTVQSVVGTPPGGVVIAASDITGLCSGSFEPGLVTIVLGGLTYTASCAAALASGGTWGLTTSQNFGHFRSGPYCSAFLCSAPLVHSGTAHNYLRVFFHVYAWKAGAGVITAQGGGNPILSVLTDVVVENGYAQTHTTAASDLYYAAQVQSSTSLTVATLTLANNVVLASGVGGAVNWTDDSTGPGTLTLGNVGGSNITTLSRSAGTWTANDNGRILVDGATGAGQICSVTVGGTAASLRVVSNFSGTSLTSGNYTMHGIGHAYATRWRQRVVVGSPVATCDSTAQTISPWSGSGTRSVMPYLASSKMVPNYATLPANVSNAGAASAGYGARPYGALANGQSTLNGDLRDYFPTSGDGPYEQIGVNPGAEVAGAISMDTDGQYRLFRTAEIREFYQWHYRDTTTGLLPTMNGGTDWAWDPRWGTLLATSSIPTTAVASGPHGGLDIAHSCNGAYLAYLLTGDFIHLEDVQATAFFFGWAAFNPGYAGSQLNRNPWFGGDQMRAMAWSQRSTLQGAAVTPDGSALLGTTKLTINTFITNTWSGVQTPLVNDTLDYGPSGPKWTQSDSNSGTSFAMYQSGFSAAVLQHARELGYLDANGSAFKAWWQSEIVVPATDAANVAPDYIAGPEWAMMKPTGGAAHSDTTWAAAYQHTAWYTSGTRTTPVNLTFPGALSGAAITATASYDPFGSDHSWYVGGIVTQNGGPGVAKITAISGTTWTLDTTVTGIQSQGGLGTYNGAAFSTSTCNNVNVPWPSPADAPLPGTTLANQPWNVIVAGVAAMMQDDGVTNAHAALSYLLSQASTNVPTSGVNGYAKYYFLPR